MDVEAGPGGVNFERAVFDGVAIAVLTYGKCWIDTEKRLPPT